MFRVRSVVLSLAALAFFAVPASAATFSGVASLYRIGGPSYTFTPTGVDLTGTVDNPVLPNQIYEANVVRRDSETFTDTVNFNFNPLLGSLLSVTNLTISGRGFSTLTAEWVGPSGTILPAFSVLGSPSNLTLPLTQGIGLYQLILSGVSNSPSGGTYIADVAVGEATPLPAAAYLFGTVLAGAAGFGMRRRRKQTA